MDLHISTSDFVLSLAEATTPEGAQYGLRDYVVTERLPENFDGSLALIKSSLDGHRSKAAYLHGSFGSGEPHFMAVLYALLSGDPAARARTEFDPVLTKHEWLTTDGMKFRLVPYHMLGAKAVEQWVLGGYVTHVKKLHPDASTPQAYRTDSLFADIRANRATCGDEAVIRGLGGGDAGDGETDEWGKGFAWTPQLLDTALAAEENHEGAPRSTSAIPPPRPNCAPSSSTTPAPTSSPVSPRTLVEKLLVARLAEVSRHAPSFATPSFATPSRGYRAALSEGDEATAAAVLAWLDGQPHVAASARRSAGVRGERNLAATVSGDAASADDIDLEL